MATSGLLPRRPLATYRRSHPVEDEETVPDSEDSISHGQSRPPGDDDGNPTSSPVAAQSTPPRPPRAVYRSRKRVPSPPPLSYSSMAPAEEVIPDSEDNGRNASTSDDGSDGDGGNGDDIGKNSPSNARQSASLGLSDWKQKLREIDDQYNADERTQGAHQISRTVPDPKASREDPFGSPLTTATSSQHTSHRLRADESLSSPSRVVSSSTNTTPQFLFGTPRTPSPSPPTSDGKPSPTSKMRTKGKGKARAHPKAHETAINHQPASSPDAIRQKRRSEKPKKTKAPTKKELLEARRETARLRSDMRASISTDATRPLDIKMLLKRFDVNQPAPSARPLQPQSSGSEIEAWSSSSPASARNLEQSVTRQDDSAEPSQHRQHTLGRRSTSPVNSADLSAPMSKYKVGSTADYDENDPFCTSASSRAPKETDLDRDADLGSSSDVEMPGIGEILAQKEARESQQAQKERLQKLKLALIEQKKASTSAGFHPGAEQDSDDDGLDVVSDTMHSVAREEAAARAAAGRTRPSVGRTAQLRYARVVSSPQRNDTHPLIPATDESPEKLMAAAAQPTFLSTLARGGGAAAGRGKRNVGMTKGDLERMVLRSAEAQSEQLRREKEEEWVRRGGRVVGAMEVVGEERIQELIGEALKRNEDTPAQGGGGDDAGSDDDDDDDDADYNPTERGSASPQQEQGKREEVQMPTEEMRANVDEGPDVALAETEVDSETESGAPNNLRRRTARPRHTIIGSDDEDGPPAVEQRKSEEDIHPPPLTLPDLPSPAFAPTASPRPAGNAEHLDHDHDHENDPDVSGNDTDKENRAVVRRDIPGSAPTYGARVLFDDILSARAGMGAPVQPSVLLTDDDPFAFTPSPAKAQEQALRRLGSPVLKPLVSKRGLSQMFEEEEGDGLAPVPALMIQGVDGERATPGEADDGLVGFKPVLGGLSQAFEETQDASGSGSGTGGLAVLRRGAHAELSLTFEAQAAALQPALEVDDRLRARAAAIFEKEQEYVLEAAQLAESRASRRELYITENGFLTQTRPEGSSPLVYRQSPSQRPFDGLLRSHSDGTLGTAPGSGTGTGTAASSPFMARQPLSTLAETSPTSSSVRREPLRRLRRAHTSPDGDAPASSRQYGYLRGQSLSPSPSPSPSRTKVKGVAVADRMERTAFTELMMGAAQRDNVKAKKKRSEFVEDQAVESDEEDMLGFGGVRKKKGGKGDEDEEEDDEHDADGVVKALVDDAHMDEKAIAKSKVLEKHLEHQTADDARLEKEVQDVVAGKRRTRRRGGAGGLLDSDESESDDEEARALRQRLAKKRRVEGDTLDALARDPATASFHATYQMALVDDADEFAHLDRDQEVDSEPEPGRDRAESEVEGEGGDDGWDGEEGDARRKRRLGSGEELEGDADEDVEMAVSSSRGAGKRRGEISAAEVLKTLQEVARGERDCPPLDPEDVSWMDQDLDEADETHTLRVRLASSSTSNSKAQSCTTHLHPADADMDVLSLNRVHAAEEQHDAAFAQRMKRWANEEGAAGRSHHGVGGGRSSSARTGSSARGAAVTGHHRPRGSSSTGAGNPVVKKKPTNAAGTATTAAPVRKTVSALSVVADRRGRFGA